MIAQREAQESLCESEERLRLFLESVTDYALLQVDAGAQICSWNAGAASIFGYNEEEILGRPIRILYVSEEADQGDAEAGLAIARKRGRFEDGRWLVRKNGSRLFGRWVTTPIRDGTGKLLGYATVLREETERWEAEEQLRASVAEKGALLQEIHHRLKNNLQVITSLLSIQATCVESPEIAAVLTDAENRVRAIAALHETLYSSEDLASIEFGSYARHVVRDLLAFYGADAKRLKVSVNAAEMVVDIGQAIPLGLILNELVTNALKHAFPEGRGGEVDIELVYMESSGEEEFGQLMVKDNGLGLPASLNFEETPSMGLHLVNILTRQLQGKLEVASTHGTSVRVRFPLSIH